VLALGLALEAVLGKLPPPPKLSRVSLRERAAEAVAVRRSAENGYIESFNRSAAR